VRAPWHRQRTSRKKSALPLVTVLPNYVDCGKPFLAFVYGIARNKVAAAHRSAVRNPEDPVEVVPSREGVPGPRPRS
jgi:RNA polymerase sigma-70 factor (ECF subfamily)